MRYRTTCPSCASIFRLGEDQLEAARGWVQCSVCGTAFDARTSLLLEDGSPVPVAEAPPDVAPVSESPESAPAAEAAPPCPPEEAAPEPAVTPGDEAATETPRGIEVRENGLDLDSIILIDPEIPVPDDPGPLPELYPTPAPYPPAPPPVPPSAATVSRPHVERPFSPEPETSPPARRPRPVPLWVWALASAVLSIALVAQLTFLLRDTLASRMPAMRPALEHMCAPLNCTLSLPRNLALLQIVGSDLQTEVPGRLRLTLTLGNRARIAQAWPVLVLTLTDQHNRPLARRSFAPSEYLDDEARRTAGIPPRSEQNLSLPLTVRDLAPMGFDLQLRY